ncbi:small glutamine-rich tetratricopeptide repeat-containing protein beta [Drosophila elegans]|uniref:small glutamine-rich tetratricopeptide repeat-containing protein beta n=1 Tax=Drosophila elegans TaxID=30023 RepID=UPI0007E5D77A|nr:small glutamine-rich tetratricopeptide repeat-containing protein beta [Drosophila elegans]
MPDAVQQSFVRSFIDYLKKQLDAMSPDQSESIEVAIQCLQAAFDVGDDVDDAAQDAAGQDEATTQSSTSSAPGGDALGASGSGSGPPKNIDIFDLFQSLYIERNPEYLALADSIKNEGNRLMKECKYNEALLQYNRAIAFDPKNPIFYCNRAAAHIRLGDNERAVTDCKSALLYNTNYSKAYCRLGVAYSNMGKFAEAEQAYGKAIELEPDNPDYRNNLEVARNARNQPPQLSHLTDGLNAMLANPTVRNLFSSAEIDLEQLQSMTQNPMVMNTIGQLFANMGQPNAGGAAPGVGGGAPPGAPGGGGAPPQIPAMPNDMLQLFQSFASQLVGAQQPGGAPNPNGNPGQQPGNQPPPSI